MWGYQFVLIKPRMRIDFTHVVVVCTCVVPVLLCGVTNEPGKLCLRLGLELRELGLRSLLLQAVESLGDCQAGNESRRLRESVPESGSARGPLPVQPPLQAALEQ